MYHTTSEDILQPQAVFISLQKIPEFRTPNELIWKGEWYVTKTRTVLMPESTGINFVERLLSEVIKYEMTSQTAEMVEGL